MTRSTASVTDWERLYAAARYHARAALELQDQPWNEHAALDVANRAGATIELLSKALLLTHDERLIADPSTVHQHLMDAIVERPDGRASEGKKAVRKQTVAASVAVELVRRLDSSIDARADGAKKVIAARNDAVHLAVALHQRPLTDVVVAMTAFAGAVIDALNQSRADFWGTHAGDVAQRISDFEAETSVAAKAAVDAARRKYEGRQKSFSDPETWAKVLALLVARELPITSELKASVDCPACWHTATVGWDIEGEAEDDHGELTYYAYTILDGLWCPVCELQLDGEQLEALDLEDMPDVSDVMEADAEAYWEDRLNEI